MTASALAESVSTDYKAGTSEFAAELPFPDTENLAGKGFLIGNNRPTPDLHQPTRERQVLAIPAL